MPSPSENSATNPAGFDSEDQANSVYKYFDDYGILIYVGITKTGVTRNRQHNADKSWWPFVAEQTVEHCESRDEAAAREVELIRRFRPPFNRQHNPEYEDIHSAYLGLRQSGAMGLNVKRVLSSGVRSIPLHVYQVDGMWVVFLTHIQHAPIAECLRHVENAKVYWGTGATLGKVRKISIENRIARIVARLDIPEGLTVDDADLNLHVASQKMPVVINIKNIRVSMRKAR